MSRKLCLCEWTYSITTRGHDGTLGTQRTSHVVEERTIQKENQSVDHREDQGIYTRDYESATCHSSWPLTRVENTIGRVSNMQ